MRAYPNAMILFPTFFCGRGFSTIEMLQTFSRIYPGYG